MVSKQVELARPQHPRRLGDDPVKIVDMFEHVAAVDDVEGRIGEGESFAGGDPIVDVQTRLGGVPPRYLNRRLRRVDARYPAPEPGELLGE